MDFSIFSSFLPDGLLAHFDIVDFKELGDFQTKKNVFAKKPFGSSKSVVEYLGRYTRKIGVSTTRIKSIDEQNVTFDYKDYRLAGVKKQMTLTHQEFIRRFSLHILPKRFVKIRHYVFLSSTWKRQKTKAFKGKTKKKSFLPKCLCC